MKIYSICVPSQYEKRFYRIKTVWLEYDFNMMILDKEDAFQATVTKEELENLAKEYELPFAKYFDLIQSSLCTDDENCLYKISDNKFFISRQENKIIVQIGYFTLTRVNFIEAIENFIDDITKSAIFYRMKLSECEKETSVYLSEKNEYAQKLEEYVRLKEEMEQKLYSKFILLLNEKKKRIQYLQERLEAYNSGNIDSEEDILDMEVDEKPGPSSLNKPEVISETDSDTNDIDCYQMKTQAQTEHYKSEDEDFLEDDIIPPIPALPVRQAVSEEPQEPEGINSASIVNKTKITKQIIENKKDEERPNSSTPLSFNTQALLERL